MQDFGKIYSDYFSIVYRFVLSLCQNPALAEDVTQESFFKALKNIDSFKGDSKLTTWLCKIAKNTLYTHTKKEAARADFPSELMTSDESLEEGLISRETAFSIHKVLHSLGEPYKEVFWLRCFGELSFSDIGVLFQKSETWARVTYYRAKTMIKEELK